MSCPICCEEFNLSSRKKIECPKCEGVFCTSCVKTYILQDQGDICMSCRCEWTNDFLASNLTRKFMTTEYREQNRKRVIEREIALLPEAMIEAENQRNIIILRNKIKEVDKEVQKLITLKHDYEMEIEVYRRRPKITESDMVSGKCPKALCRGFIKKKTGKCGICDTKVCKSCFEEIDNNTDDECSGGEAEKDNANKTHICKPENIETVKMLKKDCKPCPNCAAFISKIDGCDQMFCTQCHTAFSWKTGLIEKGRVHNPHYYEWLRSGGRTVPREPGDNGCVNGRLISYDQLFSITNYFSMTEIHRIVVHQQMQVIPNLREPFDNLQLRVDYLLKKITRKEFENEVELRDKLTKRKHDIYQCIEIFVNVMIDIFAKFYQEFSGGRYLHVWTKEEERLLEPYFKEFKTIVDFTNENLANVSRKHKISCEKFFIKNAFLKSFGN